MMIDITDQEQAHEIANAVIRDTQFWIAIVGLFGVVVGAFATSSASLLVNWLQGRRQKSLDFDRKRILLQLLRTRDWRKLSTLSRVIGADPEETRRLLIGIGARGSEQPQADGEEAWGLISKHPLDAVE